MMTVMACYVVVLVVVVIRMCKPKSNPGQVNAPDVGATDRKSEMASRAFKFGRWAWRLYTKRR